MFSIKVFSDESSSDTTERYDDVKESAVTQEDITQNNINEEESSSEDENTVSCAICLSKLKPQNLPSKPDSGCGHMFCRECLVEWSKQVLKELFGPCKSEKIRKNLLKFFWKIWTKNCAKNAERIVQKIVKKFPKELCKKL